MDKPDYFVYTDGACSNNGYETAKAGIGVYFSENDLRNFSSKIFDVKPTNNIAELKAMLTAFAIIKDDLEKDKHITIVTDSEYVIKCATDYGEKNMKKIIDKINAWSLYYRTEIVWFAIGFIVGIIL